MSAATSIDRHRQHAHRRVLRLLSLASVLFLFGLSLGVANVRADSYDERRVRTGARVFRALLAADVALENKLADDGKLHVWVYAADPRASAQIVELIVPPGDAQGAEIRGQPVHADRIASPPATGLRPPVALFLADVPSNADFDKLLAWSIANGVIIYSPFEGDVERGALGGLSIGAKVLPYVNLDTLEATKVELKPFFLKVAKQYRR